MPSSVGPTKQGSANGPNTPIKEMRCRTENGDWIRVAMLGRTDKRDPSPKSSSRAWEELRVEVHTACGPGRLSQATVRMDHYLSSGEVVITVITWGDRSGSHEMIATALGNSLTIMGNWPYLRSDLSCEAHCCVGAVLVPCHKHVYPSIMSKITTVENDLGEKTLKRQNRARKGQNGFTWASDWCFPQSISFNEEISNYTC
jgi:hypothetical protein